MAGCGHCFHDNMRSLSNDWIKQQEELSRNRGGNGTRASWRWRGAWWTPESCPVFLGNLDGDDLGSPDVDQASCDQVFQRGWIHSVWLGAWCSHTGRAYSIFLPYTAHLIWGLHSNMGRFRMGITCWHVDCARSCFYCYSSSRRYCRSSLVLDEHTRLALVIMDGSFCRSASIATTNCCSIFRSFRCFHNCCHRPGG